MNSRGNQESTCRSNHLFVSLVEFHRNSSVQKIGAIVSIAGFIAERKLPSRRSRLRCRVCSSLMVASLFCLWAGRLQASCGDYLLGHGSDSHQLKLIPNSIGPLGETPMWPSCNGPHCQRAPMSQPASVPVISIVVRELGIVTSGLRFAADFAARPSTPSDDIASTIVWHGRLERPPQILAI